MCIYTLNILCLYTFSVYIYIYVYMYLFMDIPTKKFWTPFALLTLRFYHVIFHIIALCPVEWKRKKYIFIFTILYTTIMEHPINVIFLLVNIVYPEEKRWKKSLCLCEFCHSPCFKVMQMIMLGILEVDNVSWF